MNPIKVKSVKFFRAIRDAFGVQWSYLDTKMQNGQFREIIFVPGIGILCKVYNRPKNETRQFIVPPNNLECIVPEKEVTFKTKGPKAKDTEDEQ